MPADVDLAPSRQDGGGLALVVGFAARRAWLVLAVALLLVIGAGLLAHARLGVTSDVDGLFDASLPWKQREATFDRLFPGQTDVIVCVIDAHVPEEADAVAAGLAGALSADHTHFRSVTRPDASPYFDREGLLLLDRATLEPLLEQTIDAQPFLGQLVADPSSRGLFAALSLVAMGVERGQADLTTFKPALEAFHQTLAGAADGHPAPLSWETLIGGSLAKLAGPYRFVLVRPVLDYGALEPGAAATAAIRQAASALPDIVSGAARLRITGSVPLADEEFATVAEGAVSGLVGSAVLITLWLFLAVRSWRLIVPILLTLIAGLALTTGFAAAVVGTLNLISVAFAILFVGIAVDFAIQFSVRFREMHLHEPAIAAALALTGARMGRQLVVAAAAVAAGFLAFVPTHFSGVSELGLIAGAGMPIALACTLTILPACLALTRPRGEAGEVAFAWGRRADEIIARHGVAVLGAAGLLLLAGVALTPRLSFDADPLHTKNPHTEAMQTLRDLSANPLTSPNGIEVLAPDLDAAVALAGRLSKLPSVAQTLTLRSFLPDDIREKLPLIADAANILGPTLAAVPTVQAATPADIRLAIKGCLSQLLRVTGRLPKDHPLSLIAGDLARLATAPDDVLVAANGALVRFLPGEIDRLRLALQAQPVTQADLPEGLVRDWLLPDGRARIQVVAKPEAVATSAGLHQFVAEVTAVAPEAGGAAVTIVATTTTILGAFRQAALSALVAIAVILAVALRRVIDTALVLGALLLSAAMTVIITVALPLPLNFANIIALPLLLGVGVSFNIYFVMNWRAGARRFLGSPTARALVFSALTTATAFGSLALSAHPGTASMGALLLISLGCTLAVTLVVLPAALARLERDRFRLRG